MSLDTLLEAAKYLELQEMMEKQGQASHDTAPSSTPVVVTTANGTVKHAVLHNAIASTAAASSAPLNQQTLVITSQLPRAAQSVIHTQMPSAEATSTTLVGKKIETQNRTRFIHNSFDIINPLYIDEKSNVPKRKPPPLVFRAGTREVHNKLEKHRRAHLKECFDILKKQLPASPDEKKSSNLNILHSAIRYIHVLKKKERDLEQEMERLAREKISFQTKLALLRKDLSSRYENLDIGRLLADAIPALREETRDRRDPEGEANLVEMIDEDSRPDSVEQRHTLLNTNGVKKLSLPILPGKNQGAVTSTVTSLKEVQQQPVQTALSVVPVGYPLNQGLVLQKLAIVPKGITELTPIVPTFITQQQLNGKVVPLVNAQYVVGKCPLVVVSTANPRTS